MESPPPRARCDAKLRQEARRRGMTVTGDLSTRIDEILDEKRRKGEL
jgi:hypothetical protein